MRIDQNTSPLKRALTTNAATSSFASKVPTVTEPTNDGVINLILGGGAVIHEWMLLWPIGLGADNDAFSLRVLGWRKISQGQGVTDTLWMPTLLYEFSCTISAAVGVAASPVLNTERFADTITIVTQGKYTDADSGGVSTRGNVEVTSPTNDLIAHVKAPLKGMEKIEFQFDQTTNTPTMNVLYAFL